MLMLMDGLAGDHWTEPYVDMLFEEPDLCGDGTLVIYDALHWTLQKGTTLFFFCCVLLHFLIKNGVRCL